MWPKFELRLVLAKFWANLSIRIMMSALLKCCQTKVSIVQSHATQNAPLSLTNFSAIFLQAQAILRKAAKAGMKDERPKDGAFIGGVIY